MNFSERFRQVLTLIGARSSAQSIARWDGWLDYLEVGRWMRDHGFGHATRYPYRKQLWDAIATDIGNRATLYMEFGVAKGSATRYWSEILKNPDSRLHGFDTFEGLPENWTSEYGKGSFSTNGAVPQMNDPRVQFFKGRFDETLPHHVAPPHDVLFLNIDADLYSSTRYVLTTLQDAIVPGTYIYFDEFCVRTHELRAFDEFLSANRMKFRCVGATHSMGSVAFQRISGESTEN
jgi:O-methyltransferase